MHASRYILGLATALSAMLLAVSARAELVVEQATLSNGMEIVVIPNHKVPAVSHMIWFRVGAIDDPEGKSGLAHFHEHMMFQGTKRYPGDSYSTTVRALGGEKNAFTAKDFTGYMINISKEHLAKAMELEVDRMMNLAPPPDEFPRERKVIIEERKMTVDSSPAAQLNEQMDAALYRNHPYGTPVIGWLHEMEGLKESDVMSLHHNYYHAGNAFVLITGDVTMKEVLPLAKKIYGALPPGPKVVHHIKREPPQNVERTLVLHHPEAKKPLWIRTYSVPGSSDDLKAVYPLSVLSNILGEGSTSRLYQSLVKRQKLAVSVSTAYQGFSIGPGEFSISVSPADGVSMEQVEKAVDAELATLATVPPTAEEMETAKTLYAADMVYARDSLQALNYMIGSMMAAGLGADTIIHLADKVKAVKVEEVEEALRLLKPEATVTGILLPEK